MFGLSRSNSDLDCLSNIISAGDLPIVLCGLSLYINNILESFRSNVPSVNFLKLCLEVCTACPPFHSMMDGIWYGVTRMWWIPFTQKYNQNSSKENCGTLSETQSFR